jgi:hypothetical protein
LGQQKGKIERVKGERDRERGVSIQWDVFVPGSFSLSGTHSKNAEGMLRRESDRVS